MRKTTHLSDEPEIFTTFLPIHKKVIPLQYDELYINANVVSM